MIQTRGDLSTAEDRTGDPAGPRVARTEAPWEDPEAGRALASLAFATLWTTGPDPRTDGVFRLEALRRNPESGAWEAFSRVANPHDRSSRTRADEDLVTARMGREFGVTGAELAGAPDRGPAFADLAEFLGGRPVVVVDRSLFRDWLEDAVPGVARGLSLLDLASLAGLFLPGHLTALGANLPAELLVQGRDPIPRPAALGPGELWTALGCLVGRILDRDEARLALLAHAYVELAGALAEREPRVSHELALALTLCEYPSRWRRSRAELYPEHAALTDGRLSDALRAFATLEDALESSRPAWAEEAETLRDRSPLPAQLEGPSTLDASDRRTVDEVFQELLPRRLGDERSGPSYREGQHAVAAQIAAGFGERTLFLLHAPTGTGKTLAYLVPTMLWALRHGVRVGIATFTRALQEQAMQREVPLARELLSRPELGSEVRVCVLKGRRNYVCWRALGLLLPDAEEPPEEVLAWTVLSLFALDDPAGDLDRFPRRSPLLALDAERFSSAVGELLRQARSETGCCTRRADREACAGDVARRRAERAHVVITNHAFALSRREFFRHLVFDECEHLHEVAQEAFSHEVGLRTLANLLGRLARGGARRARSARLLDRIAAHAVPGSGASNAALSATAAVREAGRALADLEQELFRYERWRDAHSRERSARDHHSLLREFALGAEGEQLLEAHGDLAGHLEAAAILLAQLSEHLDTLGARDLPRLRRTLELLRGELDEVVAGVLAWLPRDEDGTPCFGRETFHDLEVRPSGEHVLVARVLLPHEVLGRRYYPELFGAVLLSAATWLDGGFETSATYLGLTRAADPGEDEDREPVLVKTYRAPEVFDYGRVLVGVPRDAPSVTEDKDGYLDYVARFVAHLAERTRGRLLVLFTNARDLLAVGGRLEGFFSERRIPFWYQRMEGSSKEELSRLFRSHTDSVLLGLDTFWYGADFPGRTLEYLVIVRLPYGVPDRYHHAQCAALGSAEQRRQIYMPRALAKLRQGFGRLMRKESDRGCVFVLDKRILDPRHRKFLHELPAERREVVGPTQRCLDEALAHMEMKADVRRRGLDVPFDA